MPGAQDQAHHRGEREERLDLPVVGRGQVARVERQQEHRDDARHETADPVDRGVAAEPAELRAEPARRRWPERAAARRRGDGLEVVVAEREGGRAIARVLDRRVDRRALAGRLEHGVVELDQAVGDALEVVDALDVGARRPADLGPLRGSHRDELGEPLVEGVVRRVDDRHRHAVRLLRAADGLVVQERQHRLAERHALDREEPVPPGVQLVDDDVGVAVERERLVVVEALDDAELDVEPLAGAQHVVGPLPAARRRRVDDDRPPPSGRRRRGDGGEVDPRRDHGRLGHPADRVVAADDLRAGLLPVGELLGRLAADVRAEVVHHRLLAERAQDRELEGLRDERQPEREVEQVGAGEQLRERLPLRELAPHEPALEVERPVGLGVQRVAVEDDELRVDPAAAERLDVRPRHARRVDGAVDDAERAIAGHYPD